VGDVANGIEGASKWAVWAFRLFLGLFAAWAIQDRIGIGRELRESSQDRAAMQADIRALQTEVRIYHGGT
jgi:hypothetical protein